MGGRLRAGSTPVLGRLNEETAGNQKQEQRTSSAADSAGDLAMPDDTAAAGPREVLSRRDSVTFADSDDAISSAAPGASAAPDDSAATDDSATTPGNSDTPGG